MEDTGSLPYIVRVLEALNALETFSALPVSGGYLNQPMVFIRDMQAVRGIMEEARQSAAQSAEAVRTAMANSSLPDVPPPQIPKDLIDG